VDIEPEKFAVARWWPFELDDYTRWRLMEGLDDIDLSLKQAGAIEEFEKSRGNWRPTTLPARTA